MTTPHPHAQHAKLAYTTSETADLLGISVWTVRNLIRNGKLRTRNTGHRYMIPARAVEEYLDGADDLMSHPDSTGGRSA